MIKVLLFLILFCTNAFAGAMQVGVYGGGASDSCTEEESFGATDDADYNWFTVSGRKWGAFEFVPSSSYTITAFSLKVEYQHVSPSGTVTPYIYDTTSDHPNASLGGGSAVNIADLPASLAYHQFVLTSGIALTSGVHYWVVWASSSTGANEEVDIRYDSTDSYDIEIDADGVSWTEIFNSHQGTIKTYSGSCP